MTYRRSGRVPTRHLALAALAILFSEAQAIAEQIPGASLASKAQQRETTNQILTLDQMMVSQCHSRRVVKTEVTQAKGKVTSPPFSSNPESWQEHWSVDRCGTIVVWEVHYMPSKSGGTDIGVGLAKPKESAPTTPSGINADLIAAAEKGDTAGIVAALAMGAEVDTRDARHLTPLLIASYYGHADAVEALLDKGSDFKLIDKYGETALHRAASEGRNEVIKVLLAHGADVNVKSGGPGLPMGFNDETPLIEAASRHVETARLLIEHGADVNSRNAMGQTALMRAAMNGASQVVLLLLQSGADPSIRDSQGHFALSDAGRHCPPPEVARALIERSKGHVEDLNAALLAVPGGKGGPACLTFVGLLLDSGADVNFRYPTGNGNTPLIAAAIWGPIELVELLLARGADVTLKNRKGHRAESQADTREIADLLKAARRKK